MRYCTSIAALPATAAQDALTIVAVPAAVFGTDDCSLVIRLVTSVVTEAALGCVARYLPVELFAVSMLLISGVSIRFVAVALAKAVDGGELKLKPGKYAADRVESWTSASQ